jgi:hypothetical protein
MSKTRKMRREWSKEKPGFHERTMMLKKCGKKCFLGPEKSFPICKKKTCRVSQKGVLAAYKRAREYETIKKKSIKYKKISKRAKELLRSRTQRFKATQLVLNK